MRYTRAIRAPPSTRMLASRRVSPLAAVAVCLSAFACGSEADPALNPVRAAFQPASLGQDFFAVPFPDDTRLTEKGLVDLSRLPQRDGNLLLRLFLPQVEGRVAGFGTSSAVYFFFNDAIDPDSLPKSPRDTLLPGSPAFLVNVDERSPYRGEAVPLLIKVQATETKFTPPNTLVLLPFPGYPLRPAARYAAVLTHAIRDAAGRRIGTDDALRAVLRGGEAAVKPVQAQRIREAVDYLLGRGRLDKDDVAAAAVFTTQDVLGPLVRAADRVQASAPTLSAHSFKLSEKSTDCFDLLIGQFDEPTFLTGASPYQEAGSGVFAYDAAGLPLQQGTERLEFALALPKTAPPPAGYPVVLYMHGTGGDRFSYVREGLACVFAGLGAASIGIDQPVHGMRNPTDTPAIALTVNLTNINSSLDLLRQAALDTLAVSLLVRRLEPPAELAPRSRPVRFDPERILFMGHSQGSTTGVPYLAIDPDAKLGMLSGAGGNMIYFIKDRIFKGDEEVADLLGTTPEEAGRVMQEWFGVASDPVDEFHMLLSLFQTVTEPIDPVNYAPYVMTDTEHPKHVLVTEGFLDLYLPPSTNEALAAALGTDMLNPLLKEVPFLALPGKIALDPPVSLNITTPTGAERTAGDQQYETGDHWVVFKDSRAKRQVREFFRTYLESGRPVIVERDP